jgi:hypothetical protein
VDVLDGMDNQQFILIVGCFIILLKFFEVIFLDFPLLDFDKHSTYIANDFSYTLFILVAYVLHSN